ncbi:MAG: cation diffusion facilitator family transporter [Betaproteobacteria bacterium]|nr:cation diffusion facilitator family transporter [Betaproteobacteria bacterium]
MNGNSLTRYAWLSVAVALATIALKVAAWWITGSVGLLSDAMESGVNLVAALLALWMLTLAERPPDEEHAYGYSKAEYFSSGAEGGMIFIAAAAIIWSAVPRVIEATPIEKVGPGLVISVVASVINFGAARMLMRAGRRHGSITLEADAHHLLTDVWTSAGVIAGVALVWLTGWYRLDAIVAIAVALNILWTGFRLLRRSALGLLDRAIAQEHREALQQVLASHESNGVVFHALRTREAAGRSFASLHVLVPGRWSVQRGHDLCERIEQEMRSAVPNLSVITHLEPLEDPRSFEDEPLDREG